MTCLTLFGLVSPPQAGAAGWTYKRLSAPDRTLVYSGGSLLATFTDGARTVTLSGPVRTFSEPSGTSATVRTATWVRMLTSPYQGAIDPGWLSARLADRSPDVLAVAFQYVAGAPVVQDSSGLRIAGDADYGPPQPDGTRQEGSDFNDYLGTTWTYPTGPDTPEADQYGALDCSGYMRMVLGYRSGLPLALDPDGGSSLPRRSFQIAADGPGKVLIPNTGAVPKSRTTLAPGDLVFFDASTDDGTQIDHVGLYLGRDNAGHDRFISSRKTANGPTMGDLSGRSILDGTGYYATAFRTARRI